MRATTLSQPLAFHLGQGWRVLQAHWVHFALLAAYWLAAHGVAAFFGLADQISAGLYLSFVPRAMMAYLLIFLLAYVVFVMLAVRPDQLLRYLAQDLRRRWLRADRLIAGAIMIVILQLFFSLFTSMKALIPQFQPFAWDVTFAVWDRTLHGGIDPWLLLQPLLGHPWITTLVNAAYHLWFFIAYGFMVWQAFTLADPALRQQFFLTMMASWALLGNLAATLLSSAGPVYYGRVTGQADPFVPLMEYLQSADQVGRVWALQVHDLLWSGYANGEAGVGSGISAMPSMHVGCAVIFALAAGRVRRWLGWVFWAYAGLIMIGSVHLAWHYALDGYVAALLIVLIWHACGWLGSRLSAPGPASSV